MLGVLRWVLGVLAMGMGWAWDGHGMGMGVKGSVQPRLRGAARGVSRLEAVEPVLGRDQVVSREVICSRGRGG